MGRTDEGKLREGKPDHGQSPEAETGAPHAAPTAPAPAMPAAQAGAAPAAPAATKVDFAPAKGAIETAAAALTQQVSEAGLLNVHVGAGAGAVAATGTIEPAMAGRWQAIQKDFDERFGGEVTLVNSVAAKAERLPASLGIEGVWRGPQPYIVMRGQRYLVGAVVDGGWAIRGIERDRVMLEREGRLVAMRF
jgi:type III secretion protein D